MTQNEFLVLCTRGSRDEIEEALNNGADVNKHGMIHGTSVSPLFAASLEGNLEGIVTLIENGAKPADGYIASVISDNKLASGLLSVCGADINSLDDAGHTALLCAVTSNKPDAVKWLIEHGADVNVKTGGGYSVLTYAALMTAERETSEISPEIISLLMLNGADYKEALILAIRTDNIKFVSELINNGADLNLPSMKDHSPLSAALINPNRPADPEMIELLASNGADVNEVFDFGDNTISNPLNISISFNRPDIAEILLKHGANPNVRDYNGRTSLVFAVVTSKEMIEVFLEHGADPNITDNEGRTPLMLAAIDGGNVPEAAEILIVHGADVNIQDNNGLSALMWAVTGKDRSADFLISGMIRTGGIMAEGAEAWFALVSLYTAVKHELQLDVIRTLIVHGADVNLRDSKSMNALAYALMNDDEDIADILISAGSELHLRTT